MELSIKSKLSQLLNHGFIYGLTSSLQNILSFLLLPFFTVYFTPAEFGVYSIILLANTLASALFNFGAPSALGRYYFEEDTEDYRRKIISAALLISVFGAILLIGVSIVFGNSISIWLFGKAEYKLHIIVSLSAGALFFLFSLMTLILRYEKHSWLFMGTIIASVVLNFIITYLLLTKYHYGILAPLYGILWSNGAGFLFLLVKYLKSLTSDIYITHIRNLLVFGLQASVTGLLFYLVDWVDRLIIKDLLPMSDVGIYSLGYRLGSVMNVLLITPFSMIWAPIRMQYVNNKNNREFISKVSSYFAMVGFIFILIAILFGKQLMNLFFTNKEYANAVRIFPIIMLSTLFFGFQNILDLGIYLHRKVHFYIIISIIGLIFNILMNYWLIRIFGYIAAAYVSLLTYALTTGLIFLVSSKYYKLELEWGRIVWPLIVLILIYYVDYYGLLNTPLELLYKLIVLLVTIFLFLKFWITKTELDSLKLILSNYKSKIT